MTLPTTQVIYRRIAAVSNEWERTRNRLAMIYLSPSVWGGMNLLYTGRKHCFLVDRGSYYIPRTLPKCIYTGSAKKMYTHFNERKLYVV